MSSRVSTIRQKLLQAVTQERSAATQKPTTSYIDPMDSEAILSAVQEKSLTLPEDCSIPGLTLDNTANAHTPTSLSTESILKQAESSSSPLFFANETQDSQDKTKTAPAQAEVTKTEPALSQGSKVRIMKLLKESSPVPKALDPLDTEISELTDCLSPQTISPISEEDSQQEKHFAGSAVALRRRFPLSTLKAVEKSADTPTNEADEMSFNPTL